MVSDDPLTGIVPIDTGWTTVCPAPEADVI